MYPKNNGGAMPTADADFPGREKEILDYWAHDGTFRASVDQREAGAEGSNEFVFYDGPPFANGLPHYGHLLTGYAKDVIGRYQTQCGRKVERRFGWDTHGLPAELEAMRQLGVKDKDEILAMGIAEFNKASRASVMKYSRQWEKYVLRQGRWVDFGNDYKTLNAEYMESVLWAFKSLYDQGLAYSGYRVLPYCWRDETPLSNHELRMDEDVYQNRQDPSVTVIFPFRKTTLPDGSDHPLSELMAGPEPVAALAWTTTPWTTPSNLALAVGPEIEYVVVPKGPEGNPEGARAGKFLLAAELLDAHAKDLGYTNGPAAKAAILSRHIGTELAGLRYEPLFDYYTDTVAWGTQEAWQVLVADYVTIGDGTGIVHQAPAYGEEDQKNCEAAGIPVILSVDDSARFLPMFGEGLAGAQVFEANRILTQRLRAGGRLVRQSTYEHSYPHCWRCRTPLIYRAVESWFVAVTRFKDRMVELNRKIQWIPENVKYGQFGKWLENARDWSISRNRFWGTPVPVWISDNPEYPRKDVYGSLAELEADFGRLPRDEAGAIDLHRPFIDELIRPNPDDPSGRSTMRRVPDVMDVWFDSGSMPYAQVHYPFENKEWFAQHNPADFIVEYIGQTRGWFYLLHVLSTALFSRPAFRNVISHGIVLGSDGQKMSKSLRNYPDVGEVFDRDGSDAMRWFLMSSPILRGGNLKVTEEGIREGARQALLPLWNVYSFFVMYANAVAQGKGYNARYLQSRGLPLEEPQPLTVLDRFLLAKTGQMTREVAAHLDGYNISAATATLRDYIDVLTNWYVRRSRQRFFEEQRTAFDVLYTALVTVTQAAAPFLPFLSEYIWRGLTGGRSVHLTDWPVLGFYAQDSAVVRRMELTRKICTAGSALRKAAKLRVRLPLSKLTVVDSDAADLSEEFMGIIESELNIKKVVLSSALDRTSYGKYTVTTQLAVNARTAGPRLGKRVQHAIKAAKSGEWSVTSRPDGTLRVVAGGIVLEPGEYDRRREIVEEPNSAESGQEVALFGDHGLIVLDTAITPELEAEGMARDMTRKIQNARKAAGFDISDRIITRIVGSKKLVDRLRPFADLIVDETLTKDLLWNFEGDAVTVDDAQVSVERIGVRPVS